TRLEAVQGRSCRKPCGRKVCCDSTRASVRTIGESHASLKSQCTNGPERRIKRWEHEYVLEAVQQRLDKNPQAMRQRRETAEHPFALQSRCIKPLPARFHTTKTLSDILEAVQNP